MNWNQANQTFVEESRGLLWSIEDALLRIESGGDTAELNSIFLAVQALRESAEFFDCAHVVPFAQMVENLVGKIRDYEIKPASKLITSLFLCCDHLHGLVDQSAYNHAGTPDTAIGDIVEYFTSADERAMLRSLVAR